MNEFKSLTNRIDSLNFMQLFAKTTTALIVITNTKGFILWCNDRFSDVYEVPKNKIIGSYLGDHVVYPKGVDIEVRMQEAIDKGCSALLQTSLVTRTGNEKFIHHQIYRMDDKQKQLIGFFGIGYELTMEKRVIDDSKTAIRVLNEMREEEIKGKQLEVIEMMKVQCNVLCTGEAPHGKYCPAILAVEESLIKGQPSLKALLTNAELQVAKYVKMGMPTKRISNKMGISERTVKNHRHAIRKKLNISQTNISLTNYLQSLPT